MVSPNLIIRISGNSKQFQKELKILEKQVNISNKKMTKSEIKHQNQSFRRIKESEKARIDSFNRIKKAALAVSLVAAGITVVSLRAFANYETALVAVVRTTGLAGKELRKFTRDISKLSSELKTPEEELLKIAEVAGQLGVKGAKNITVFTAAMAKFNVASATLRGAEAATAFARIIQLTGGDISKVENYGSAVAHLADNFNATEAQIAETAKEISKVNAIFKLSTENTIAIATGFASVGVEAEVASTSMGMFAKKIDEALTKGGSALNTLTVITGMSRDEIEKNLIDATEKVFIAFTKGLKEVGSDAGKVLTDLGLNNIRTSKAFLSASQNVDIFTDAIEQSNEASIKNIKLQQETDLVLKTTAKAYDGMKDAANDALRVIGKIIGPTALKVMNGIAEALGLIVWRLNLVKDIKEDVETVVPTIEGDTDKKPSPLFAPLDKTTFTERTKALREQEATEEQARKDSLEKLEQFRADKNEILAEDIQKEAELTEEGNIKKDVVSEERRTKIAELLAGLKEEKLSTEEQDFQDDLTRLEDRLEKIDKTKAKFAGMDVIRDLERLKAKTKDAKELAKIDDLITKAKAESFKQQVQDEVSALTNLFDKKTAIGKAVFLADKAFKIANAITNTHTMISNALADFPFPQNVVIAGLVGIKGAAEVASISGISAQDGGVVPGGFGGGDRVPALLEPGEVIVPQRFNPLSPNFEEGLGGAGTEVNVNIDLTEDASRFITAGQREDSRLGIQE